MMYNLKNKASKIIAIILAMIIAAMSFPFAFAATQISLKASNVTVWPTATGEMYFGQSIGEMITLTGGEVQYNGTVVPGHFEHIDPDATAEMAMDAYEADIKFVPDDTTTYKGFNKYYSKTTFVVHKTTPVLADQAKPPVVTDLVEPGVTLSTVVISDGSMVNPYDSTESKVKKVKWEWVNPDTVVSDSGFYEAQFKATASCYVTLKQNIYVEVNNPIPFAVIDENPTIESFDYNPNITWGDIEIKGGKAIMENTDGTKTDVIGKFSFKNEGLLTVSPSVGIYNIDLVFTPDDTTIALPCETTIQVTVNKAVPTFRTDDESGVPTITMPYGTKLDSSLDYKIKPLVDVDVPVYLAYKDLEGNDFSYNGTTPVVGTHEIQVRVNIDDSNYETFTMLTFNLEITGFESSCIVVPVGSEGYKIVDEGIAYNVSKPTGTFTVSYTVNGEKQPDITVKYGELFQIEKVKSGDYVFTVTYNEIENDPFSVVVKTFEIKEKLGRNVKIGENTQKYTYGDTVTVTAPATDPAKPDKPYYGFTGWEVKGNIGLSDEELANAEISFAMPDEDVELNATYEFSLKLFFEWIWQQIVQFFTFFINAMKDLFALTVA